jgi:DNA-binding CsgD family transcriptional regulator
MVRALPVVSRGQDGFRGAVLLVSDAGKRPQPAPALLARLFRLTPAEASLAASLAAGRSLDDHAKRRGIARETVRSQLAAIRRKTGCRRQTDLVALLARIPG